MKEDTAQKAIKLALAGEWEKAIKVNKKILKETPKDTDALNRLARAYAEVGNLKKAKETAKKVLKIDPFNNIAQKALSKWKSLKKSGDKSQVASSAEAFLEEPGKTKIVSLLHLGAPKTLAGLDTGDELKLNTHKHRVSVTTQDGKYVGRLADDISARLRELVRYGNEYQVLVKSIDPQESVKVFIREIKRSPKLSDIPSFSTEKIDYISFTPPELVHKKDVEIPQDDEEKEE
jgi:hypothetical protein